MSQILFRSVVSVVLTLLVPAQLLGQDSASGMVHAGPVGQIVDGSGQQKKPPGGRFSAFPVPGAGAHPD